MIFSGNTTALSAYDIPVAEGYDCATGAAKILVESAKNDFAMMEAMLKADYSEMAMMKAGYTNESSQIVALQEASIAGIFKAIKEFLKKLAAKVKAIFESLCAKLAALFMKDSEYVKKYKKYVDKNKEKVGKLEVTYHAKLLNSSLSTIASTIANDSKARSAAEFAEKYAEDESARIKNLTLSYDSIDAVKDGMYELYVGDEKHDAISTIPGGIDAVANLIVKNNKTTTDIKNAGKEITKHLNKLADDFDKTSKDNKKEEAAVKEAKNSYDTVKTYSDILNARISCLSDFAKMQYKECKSIFVKAVSTAMKKESFLVDALAEAAADEVEDVINGAISKETISDLSVAGVDVKDADVCDCGDLTYGEDCYTKHAPKTTADGSVDAAAADCACKESAFFSEPLFQF